MIERVDGVVQDGFAVLAVGFGLAEGPVVDRNGGAHRRQQGRARRHLTASATIELGE